MNWEEFLIELKMLAQMIERANCATARHMVNYFKLTVKFHQYEVLFNENNLALEGVRRERFLLFAHELVKMLW